MIKYGEKEEGMISLWSVAVGNIPLFFGRKQAMEALKYISEQEGFVGIHRCYPRGTLCLFKTLNDAKGARNMMRLKGIQCGDNICEVYVHEIRKTY